MLPPPTVVNIRKGGRADVYIGLGSKWGNRFANIYPRAKAVALYEKWLRERMYGLQLGFWRPELRELSGKVLGCHCKPKACHGDVIVKLFLELWGDPSIMELDDKRGKVGC